MNDGLSEIALEESRATDGVRTPIEMAAGVLRPSYVDWYGRERRQNWRTPQSFFEKLDAEFAFTLDGASEPGNGLLPRASTAEQPIPWAGERVFCNPPWSDIPPFVEYAAHADLAVLLVPARTNSKWFHRALELGASVRFFPKRIAFEGGPVDQKGHNSPVDCVLLVFDNSASPAGVSTAPTDSHEQQGTQKYVLEDCEFHPGTDSYPDSAPGSDRDEGARTDGRHERAIGRLYRARSPRCPLCRMHAPDWPAA